MEKIIVRGGHQLEGTVRVEGAKNAVLPVIAASLIASEGKSVITDVPELADVYTINQVLSNMNADVTFENNTVTVDASNKLTTEAPFEYVRKMRASVLVIGPLLARYGHAKVAMPGGCAIGSRPIDLHLKGFEAMGAETHVGNGFVELNVDGRLKGAKIYLDMPSVGATENIMMAAALAEGKTIIENCAKEPEIVDLANYLNKMGAKVVGAGTETIRIEGVDSLHGVEHTIIPDRVEAGTFMVAAAITNGNVLIENAEKEHLRSVISKLEEMNVSITEEDNGLRVIGPKKLKATDIKTLPHPGFPTDMQSQMMALMLAAQGTSVITETVFENRFMHVEEFRRMNAKMKIEGHSVIIEGPSNLQGAEVAATDLRAAAALILAGLCAEGVTRVTELKHLDRGYVDFSGKLASLGADIERVDENGHAIDSFVQVDATNNQIAAELS
ncbi:UDP-N-acetylglucosamine 1-carboxyvinyltransferase [Virgibacillus sp. AGTR]|uniref:UDP-N-acetylglucosamine 1-carboxyvinyltransferase n=1 Tax=Virgibacillus salarius TaxID=447199 RepID=A0A941DS38_9BACI|nr:MULTISPECIES: UDP-N-acetylglucosamine 1-carboxyvinyltransferase [Bacillaceae]NAZ08363.1 UDP-N-acetylglucosamine 1-carboxyvinyltransferase [Agaribacter marinus]MBR7795650.1 UDP-N-acetylglucosamine 1-carboxyvinyltransferase [Virgibacillus salarius]MCC2251293.1 UDP-N-acetylglucosamine 1-carboxyvinyltransferase [Virgibacillus sp. AGTR]MDY7045640.1 UDP-N-acetylglucosamine 1-carboxyvinyltransferase [Virgibacillus sp. M23]QRZ18518.1 UDP-N-acetylglucosamine 1-carboxyvinyltransferase [Virgibacillus 